MRRGAVSVALTLACGFAPVAMAGASTTTTPSLPAAGSTAPGDDLTTPTFGAIDVADATSWLQAGVTARSAEVATLNSDLSAATGLPNAIRTTLTGAVTSASQSLANLSTSDADDTDIHQIRQDAQTMIGLHVFSVLAPQVTEITSAETIKASAIQLLAQEVSIRAALVAAKTAKASLTSATAQLTAFHAHLVQAKSLVDPLPAALVGVGALSVTRATSKLSSAANAESTATVLVTSAKSAEQSIVASLTSKLRAKRRSA